MTPLSDRLRTYKAAAYPAHGAGFVAQFTAEGQALMIEAATELERLSKVEEYAKLLVDEQTPENEIALRSVLNGEQTRNSQKPPEK